MHKNQSNDVNRSRQHTENWDYLQTGDSNCRIQIEEFGGHIFFFFGNKVISNKLIEKEDVTESSSGVTQEVMYGPFAVAFLYEIQIYFSLKTWK